MSTVHTRAARRVAFLLCGDGLNDGFQTGCKSRTACLVPWNRKQERSFTWCRVRPSPPLKPETYAVHPGCSPLCWTDLNTKNSGCVSGSCPPGQMDAAAVDRWPQSAKTIVFVHLAFADTLLPTSVSHFLRRENLFGLHIKTAGSGSNIHKKKKIQNWGGC